MQRRHAKAAGLNFYSTGKPCRRGHVSERHTVNSHCVECVRLRDHSGRAPPTAQQKARANEQAKLRYHADIANSRTTSRDGHRRFRQRHGGLSMAEHRKRVRDRADALRAERTAVRLAQKRGKAIEAAARRAASLERSREQSRQWRAENPERQRALVRAWKARNRPKVNARNASSKRNRRKSLIEALSKVQRGRCAYCETRLAGVEFHVDHIVPLALGGADRRSNLQLTCAPCNIAKSARDPIDFAQSLGRLL